MLVINTEKIAQKNRGFLAVKNYLDRAYAQLSLRRKISVPFISVFLGIWISGTVAVGYYFSRDIEAKQLQEVEAVASLVLREFQRETQKLRLNAKLLVEGTRVETAIIAEDRTALLQNLLPLKTTLSLDLIKVIDRESKVLIDLRNQQLKELELDEKVAISQVVNGVDFSSVIKTTNNGASILIGTAPIKSSRGVIGGIIIGTVVNDKLLDEIAKETNEYIVAFQDGKIIASTLADASKFSWKLPPEKIDGQLSVAKVKIGDRSYLGETVTLSGLNNTELKLVILASLEPLETAKQNFAIAIILFSLLGVAIALGVGYGVSSLIAARIGEVTNAIEKIAEGNLKTKVPVTYNDEIDKLAIGFNLMAEQLEERNRQLSDRMQQLEETLQKLSATQVQLIQSEKMSSLGQMVAGIAHEFNNPVSFIYGNVDYALKYVDDLLAAIRVYQEEYPNPTPLVEETLSNLELDFVVEDLQKLLSSMKNGAARIRDIVQNLRTFSRLDQTGMKKVNFHENLEATLSFLQHRLQGIEIVKEYGNLPRVNCNPGQLNQVFINIINNGIDFLENTETPQIKITMETTDSGSVKIKIADNGPGMTEEVRQRVFNPFFTTKPVGSGTGLGLSISYSIVVEYHRGRLSCISAPGQGTEFIIEIPNN